MMTRVLCALAALAAAAFPVRAQGALERLSLSGAGSQTGTGALRCSIGERAELSLQGLDASLAAVPLEQYAPEVTSTNEKVLIAKLASYSSYIVNAVCVADGEAWITVKSAGVETSMPALVGKSRSKATPTMAATTRAMPIAGPAERAVATPTTPTTPTTTPGVLPAGNAPERATMASRQTPSPIDAEERRGASLHVVQPVADAPAVPATGLTLFAGYGEVVLQWHPAPGAVGYRIARKDVATNTLETLTGESVGADGRGLLTDTGFVDIRVIPGKQYAYYLGTYFRHANGSYYSPEPAVEAHGVATPRDPMGQEWLPLDWRDPVTLTSVSMENGSLVLTWRPKFAAMYYAFSTAIGVGSQLGSCGLPDTHKFDMHLADTTFTKNIVSDNSDGARVTMYCVGIRALFPESMSHGQPSGEMGNYIAFAAVGRSCPASSADPCSPWRIIPAAEIQENHIQHWARFW